MENKIKKERDAPDRDTSRAALSWSSFTICCCMSLIFSRRCLSSGLSSESCRELSNSSRLILQPTYSSQVLQTRPQATQRVNNSRTYRVPVSRSTDYFQRAAMCLARISLQSLRATGRGGHIWRSWIKACSRHTTEENITNSRDYHPYDVTLRKFIVFFAVVRLSLNSRPGSSPVRCQSIDLSYMNF